MLQALPMSESEKDAIMRHIRGATVVHRSPFSTIEVPSVPDLLSEEECEKWVVPFYRVSFRKLDLSVTDALRAVYPEITPSIVERLLTDFDWRPRLTAAFFAGLKRFDTLEDHIGRLLLRSDLCYAGTHYCVALAVFNTQNGTDFLKRYLGYYLTRPDLGYNQTDAIGAVAFMDAANGTKHLEEFLPLWETYVNATSWKPDLQRSISHFAAEMEALRQCRAITEQHD